MKSREDKHATLPTDLQNLVLEYVELSPSEVSFEKKSEKIYQDSNDTMKDGLTIVALPPLAALTAAIYAASKMDNIQNPATRDMAKFSIFVTGSAAAIALSPITLVGAAAVGLTTYSVFGAKKHFLSIEEQIAKREAKKAVAELSYYIDKERLQKKLGK